MKIRQLLWLVPLFLIACGGPDESAPLAVVEDEAVPTLAPVAVVEETAVESGETAEPAVEADAEAHNDDDDDHGHDHDEEVSEASDGIASSYLGSYTISDNGFGTDVTVTVDEGAQTRTITTNALPNHDAGEFPNSGNPHTISAQDLTWVFPTEPAFVGTPTRAGNPGVAVNGIKFAPGTAERATCDSGETHSVEAIQDVADLGLDFNNAHVQPTGEYHYHGVSELLVDVFNTEQDLVHIGFAADGHLMYYSKSNAYQSSYRIGTDSRAGTNCAYTNRGQTISFGSVKDGSLSSDWDYDPSYGDLDVCNGMTVDGEYIYLVTHDYPYISRCLMGEFTDPGPDGEGVDGAAPSGQGDQGGQGGGQGARPDFDAAAAVLGVSAEAIREAMGPPPGDLEAGAAALGVTVEELQDALGMQTP